MEKTVAEIGGLGMTGILFWNAQLMLANRSTILKAVAMFAQMLWFLMVDQILALVKNSRSVWLEPFCRSHAA